MIPEKYAYRSEVMKYAKSIVNGKKIACVETKEAAQRFLDDIDSKEFDVNFTDADFVIGIIEKTFVHIKGPKKNQPLLLEPWQKFIVYNLLGFYIKGTDERRFKEAFIFIPRKNGKTTFVSALSWGLALLERKTGSTIYIVGNVLKQALQSFEILKKNIYQMEGGEKEAKEEYRILDNNQEHSISKSFYNEAGEEDASIKLEALASNPDNQDGYNCNIAICDEMHAYKTSEKYYVIRQAMKAYRNKLCIGITTAGKNMNSFCYHRLDYCQKVLKKQFEDKQLFIFICKADQDEKGNVDITDPKEQEKANPNYNVSVRAQDLMDEALQANNDVTAKNQYLNKSLNVYTNELNKYFNIALVQASDAKYNWTIDELAKMPIKWFGGADLSIEWDLSATCLYGIYNDIDIIIPQGYMPRIKAQEKAEKDQIPFFWWEEQKWLTICNSETIEPEELVKWFVLMRNKGFKIQEVRFDRYKSRDFVASMEKNHFNMVDQDQHYWKKSEGFRRIEKQILKEKLYYLHSKAYEYCIGNVRGIEDSEDRVRFEKNDSNSRIDIFDCSVSGAKGALEYKAKADKIKGWF
ncbi:MAG: terminase large subunit [Clostridia bacterium]|nr:terminase large subunit [Clostridia bacterium]